MKNLNVYTVLFSIALVFLFGYYVYSRTIFWKELNVIKEKIPNLDSKFFIFPKWFTIVRISLLSLSAILLIISLMNPHISEKKEKEEKLVQGVDIIFVVDVSLSMYAIDVPPNRLSRFKEVLLSLLPELQGNRFGMITFAGSSFLYCPMTSDISAFSDYVRGLDVDMIPEKGTNLSKALKKAEELLRSTRVQKNKLLVLVTDGEDQTASLVNLNVPFVIWGVGTLSGGAIYYKDEESNLAGYVSKDRKLYPSINDGQTIISKLDEIYLKKLASRNSGEYWNIGVEPSSALQILQKINSIEKNANQFLREALLKDGYAYFLLPAFLLLFLELIFELFIRNLLKSFKKA